MSTAPPEPSPLAASPDGAADTEPAAGLVPLDHIWSRVGVGLRVVAAALVVGVGYGVLWAATAPRVDVVLDGAGNGTTTADAFTHAISAEVWFGVLGLAVGIVFAIAVHLVVRDVGPGTAVAMAIGGLFGALVAARVGVWLGGHAGPQDAGLPAGSVVYRSLRVSGAFELAWPVASMAATTVAGFFLGLRAPRPTS